MKLKGNETRQYRLMDRYCSVHRWKSDDTQKAQYQTATGFSRVLNEFLQRNYIVWEDKVKIVTTVVVTKKKCKYELARELHGNSDVRYNLPE